MRSHYYILAIAFSTWGAVSGAPREGGDHLLTTQVEPDDVDRLTAKIALAILETTLEPSTHGKTQLYVFTPSTDAVSFDEAVATIVRMPKPLGCTATRRSQAVHLECIALSGDGLRDHGIRMAVMDHQLGSRVAQHTLPTEGILLVVGTDKMLVPGLAISRWYRDYAWPAETALTTRSPTDAERAQGATSVIMVGKVRPVPPDSIPKGLWPL